VFPLAEVLEPAGIRAGACEVLFLGVDRETVPGLTGPIDFERSLTLDDASSSEILLAYAMNGAPLPSSTDISFVSPCGAVSNDVRQLADRD
jgi:DMSO/TMAO reductase YedYZ molybdopterin-dependent catalytic subunit